jgi:hypothetical protein
MFCAKEIIGISACEEMTFDIYGLATAELTPLISSNKSKHPAKLNLMLLGKYWVIQNDCG